MGETKQLNLNANSNGKSNGDLNGNGSKVDHEMNGVPPSQPIRDEVDRNVLSNHSLPHLQVHGALLLPRGPHRGSGSGQNEYGPFHGPDGVVEHHGHHQSERNGHHHHLERHRNERIHRKMIRSSLRFKLLVRGDIAEYVVGSGPDIHRQMEGLRVFMEGMQSVNDLQWIKIWIFCDLNVVPGQEIWLCTDREQVNVSL